MTDMLQTLRELMARNRELFPWRDWGKRHTVALILSEWLELDQAFVMTPGSETEFVVAIHPETMREVRVLFIDHRVRPTDQEIAEFMAWSKAEMPEPPDGR